MKEIHRQLPLGRYQSMLNLLAVVLEMRVLAALMELCTF